MAHGTKGDRMAVRCKFRCESVEKTLDWRDRAKFLYTAKFVAVMDGSEENKKFWAATPGGSLSVSCVTESSFVPGKEYFLDLIEV
jgi:hypothetical protein